MPSLTVENYLKAALLLSTQTGSESITTGQMAAALSVTPGTVTSMLKTLADSGLASYKPYAGVSLTRAGRTLALRVLRRHRLIELFLVKTLNLTWDQVHDEAERMEHSVSDSLIDRIDEFLGHPETDPHGDPIPSSDGRMRNAAVTAVSVPLARCPAGSRIRITRVLNQQPEFLRFLSENNLALGTQAVVDQNLEAAGIITLKVGRSLVSLGHPAANDLLVEQLE